MVTQPVMYIMYICSLPTAPCSPNPCQNGATCFDIPPTTFFCNCQPGFTGLLCEGMVCENVQALSQIGWTQIYRDEKCYCI